MSRQCYVYALLDSPLEPPRLPAHRLEILATGGLFAAVERMGALPAISEASLRVQHEIVVRLAGVTDAILPVRYGALLPAAELAEVVRLRYDVLHRALDAVRGQEQMTIRIFGASPRTPAPQREARSGTAYLRARVALARVPRSAVVTALRRALRPLVTAERAEPGRGTVQIVLNHLIPRGTSDIYREHVTAALASLDPQPPVVVSGPWPPFAFTPDLWSPDAAADREEV